MVEKVKKAGRDTGKVLSVVWTMAALVSAIAAALGVIDKPRVATSLGELPLWQFVATVLLTVVGGYVTYLVHKKGE